MCVCVFCISECSYYRWLYVLWERESAVLVLVREKKTWMCRWDAVYDGTRLFGRNVTAKIKTITCASAWLCFVCFGRRPDIIVGEWKKKWKLSMVILNGKKKFSCDRWGYSVFGKMYFLHLFHYIHQLYIYYDNGHEKLWQFNINIFRSAYRYWHNFIREAIFEKVIFLIDISMIKIFWFDSVDSEFLRITCCRNNWIEWKKCFCQVRKIYRTTKQSRSLWRFNLFICCFSLNK